MLIRHTAEFTVVVTTNVTTAEATAWGISGLGLSNEKGESSSELHELTYKFDLATPLGESDFIRLCQQNLPPTQQPALRDRKDRAKHDSVGMLGSSSNVWTGGTWEERKEVEGVVTEEKGGYQAFDANPGWIAKKLRDKEIHSHAQIVRTAIDGKETGARAELTLSGESGEANRAEFGKIFGGGVNEDAKASGKWKLSAPVSLKTIHEMEAVNTELRLAPTLDEKMKIYAGLVEKNGAAMLGGQVGITSKSWDLELKGDENFPGESGRQQLNQLGKDMRILLKTGAPTAHPVLLKVDDELAKLAKRRKAVADEKKYTDLPPDLRKEQLFVIDQHITDLSGVKRSAASLLMKTLPAADVASSGLQKKIAANEAMTVELNGQIARESKALLRVISRDGSISTRVNDRTEGREESLIHAKTMIAAAHAADAKHASFDGIIDGLRNAWTLTPPAQQLGVMQMLDAIQTEKIKGQRECVDCIERAAMAVARFALPSAMLKHRDFWEEMGANFRQ